MNLNSSYSLETSNLGHIWRFLAPCDLEIWRVTLKNNKTPLLSNIKLYVSFHHHMWIQTGVTVRKRFSWVVTSVTLTFDLCPWPFAWTLPWFLEITPENFMMIRWWKHSEKGCDGQTDGQTDGQKIPFIELLGRSKNVACSYFVKLAVTGELSKLWLLKAFRLMSTCQNIKSLQNIYWGVFP